MRDESESILTAMLKKLEEQFFEDQLVEATDHLLRQWPVFKNHYTRVRVEK